MARRVLLSSHRMPELSPDPLDKMTTIIILVVLLRLLGGC